MGLKGVDGVYVADIAGVDGHLSLGGDHSGDLVKNALTDKTVFLKGGDQRGPGPHFVVVEGDEKLTLVGQVPGKTGHVPIQLVRVIFPGRRFLYPIAHADILVGGGNGL